MVQNIGKRYTSDYIINKHTILTYYLPFLPKARQEQIINAAKYENCSSIYTKLGIIAGSLCKKDGIYYCSVCAKDDIQLNGEAYIHREHQLQGVKVCPHHGKLLRRYILQKKDVSRVQFIRLDNDLLDLTEASETVENYEIMLKLSKAAYYLLETELKNINKDVILEKYKNLLYEKGLTTSSKQVKQMELYEEFQNFYGDKLLMTLESSIDNDNEYNWLRVITRDLRRVVHPIRHLLIINFLVDNIEEFFKDINNKYNPFGEAPWPCLNKMASHYKKNVVKSLKITEDYKSRLPVGTFNCSCGFVYSRKGPDISLEDRYKIGRIKDFGAVWENKLNSYLKEHRYGLRELARLMKCDPKTIIKFDLKFGTNNFKNNTTVEELVLEDNKSILDIYKKDILDNIALYPIASRTEIRSLCKKQYTYIYRRDKEWLYKNLPNIRKSTKVNKKVDWNKRDNELLDLIKKQYEELIKVDIPIRITKSVIGKRLDILATLEKKLDKLPRTQLYLTKVIETVEEFQLRRCIKIIKDKLSYDNQIKLWEIQRLAAIKSSQFKKLKDKLKEYIDNAITGG